MQSLYNKTEQMRLIPEGNSMHPLGITEPWLNNSHAYCEIAIYGYTGLTWNDTIGLKEIEMGWLCTSMRV